MQFYKSNIQSKMIDVVDFYYVEVGKSEEAHNQELKSVTKVQSIYRMHVLRKQFRIYKKATMLVQKFLRGMLARFHFKQNARKIMEQRCHRYYSNQVILIQKTFRGFYKRKYFHEFAARKKYLSFLKDKNEKFLQELRQNELMELNQKKSMEEIFAREEFLRIASNLHHLSSTQIQPGVYNKPLSRTDTVFDLPVEIHLKKVFHKNYQTLRKKQAIRYKEREQEEQQQESPTRSLINGGGGAIKHSQSQKVLSHYQSLPKIKLAPI